jgi:hypothetical protein
MLPMWRSVCHKIGCALSKDLGLSAMVGRAFLPCEVVKDDPQ